MLLFTCARDILSSSLATSPHSSTNQAQTDPSSSQAAFATAPLPKAKRVKPAEVTKNEIKELKNYFTSTQKGDYVMLVTQ